MVIATLTLHSSPGFYDPTELVYSPAHSPAHSAGRTTRLEQTIFLVLASLAGVAFMVIITLLLCRFQCQVVTAREIMMGVGNRVASVTLFTFTSEPCPHAHFYK